MTMTASKPVALFFVLQCMFQASQVPRQDEPHHLLQTYVPCITKVDMTKIQFNNAQMHTSLKQYVVKLPELLLALQIGKIF